MRTIDLIGIMKTVATVTPLEGNNKFLVKYGNHKQVVITVDESAQQSVKVDGAEACVNCGEPRSKHKGRGQVFCPGRPTAYASR